MLTNKEIDTLIKMENVIGLNQKELFKEDIQMDNYLITEDDFIDFINLIERILQNKKEVAKKQRKRNSTDKEYHTIINSISYFRKTGNKTKLEEWQHRLEEYKQNK